MKLLQPPIQPAPGATGNTVTGAAVRRPAARSGPPPKRATTLDLWGGIECTYNRVHDRYFNQLAWNGHLHRPSDLDRFAELGITALRYPVIWEMLAPDANPPDWSFADERLPRLRELMIRPIATLEHHGSGPRHAPIGTPAFASGLARFARAVAERYPWLEDYTPVNEPLTTARFCGLYAVWYPHAANHRHFVRMVAAECRATILAMREIRRVNPAARLIQTDDLGKVYCTPTLQYEADYQNHRRWLAWDLLCGKVDGDHPLRAYLLDHGLTPRELDWFQTNACGIDIIGINHYPTSDRFLDEDPARYPGVVPTDNGRQVYADVEAVRVRPEVPDGFYARLMEAWHRYHLPLAITECHLGCTREEQLRWFADSWNAAAKAQSDGADVRAVTAWSLLGAYNWNTLVTHDANYYEPGVFDVRGGKPRATAVARLLKGLAEGGRPNHFALDHPGWWQRPERLFATHRPTHTRSQRLWHHGKPRCLLILGAHGTLGRAFVTACEARALPYRALARADLDLGDPAAVNRCLRESRPWGVINATGYVRVDDAEQDEAACFAVNTHGATRLARACRREGSALMCFSSDLVFDGKQRSCYLESHPRAPLNNYGRSKAAMEERVLHLMPGALVVRTSAFFSPDDDWNVLTQSLRALARGQAVWLANDVVISPTYVPDLVGAAFDLWIDGANGIWHLSNAGALTWADLAQQAAIACGIRHKHLRACSQRELNQSAVRPPYSALGTEKGQILPAFDDALARYARDVRL